MLEYSITFPATYDRHRSIALFRQAGISHDCCSLIKDSWIVKCTEEQLTILALSGGVGRQIGENMSKILRIVGLTELTEDEKSEFYLN